MHTHAHTCTWQCDSNLVRKTIPSPGCWGRRNRGSDTGHRILPVYVTLTMGSSWRCELHGSFQCRSALCLAHEMHATWVRKAPRARRAACSSRHMALAPLQDIPCQMPLNAGALSCSRHPFAQQDSAPHTWRHTHLHTGGTAKADASANSWQRPTGARAA